MAPLRPGSEDPPVLVVKSQARPDGGRWFGLEGSEDVLEEELLREKVEAQRQEGDLVEALRELGYRLTMVGGGASAADTRRFYFRRAGDGFSF